MRDRALPYAIAVLALAATIHAARAASKMERPSEVPVTTASPEARELYLAGRSAAEQLRVEDGRRLHEQAVARDPDFALAHLALANAAPTAQGFFESLRRAVELAPKVSEGERHLILAQDAGVRGDPASQREHLEKLVEAFPDDARARTALGNLLLGRQEYEAAIEQYDRALAIAPGYAPAYNQAGYAQRFLGRYAEAERAFRKYAELLPKEPNPLDSLAELLMKMGRFDESIAQYRRALSLDPRFVASYVGIANDQIFLGKPAEARRTLAKLRDEVARTTGERRQAIQWIAVSFIHEGKPDRALAALREMYGVAEQEGDGASMSGDLVQMGVLLLRTGKPDEAAERFARAVATIEGASVPAEVKENVRRNHLYQEALVALARNDLAGARHEAEAYRAAAEARRIPFELRRVHELAGMVAMHAGDAATAATELAQASQQDPWVLYQLARALDAKGDRERALEAWKRTAHFNGLSVDYAFVRANARKRIAKVG